MHHERLDGSGYHRAALSSTIPIAARVLAAADTFQALGQARPHRPAFGPDEVAARVGAEAGAGRLDREVVAALLAASGREERPARTAWPAGLSDRQVEVLRLVAAGFSNREVAMHLSISPRTAEHHVQDVYLRIGVSSRAAAAMFAMEHDLLRGPARLDAAGHAGAPAATPLPTNR
jgi:DNA-binding NarL/FixJ family response regulator